ncbi:MAG: hypothetical protein O2861_14650, partial [Proteobacteria bacterium]|nr:hypothetical protein [Pseudomonadota bacterium]
MTYLAEEITFDSDGLAEFGPMMTEDDIREGEETFHEYQTLRRAVMIDMPHLTGPVLKLVYAA